MNVLNCCKKYNVSKLIHFSTYRAFGNDICEKYNESNFHSCYNISNNKGYLFSKKVLDLQIQLFKQNSSTEIICLILPNIFGALIVKIL
jgi:nucleoside-diphosphate-sugar epimerase